jgi:hypothetical protein
LLLSPLIAGALRVIRLPGKSAGATGLYFDQRINIINKTELFLTEKTAEELRQERQARLRQESIYWMSREQEVGLAQSWEGYQCRSLESEIER